MNKSNFRLYLLCACGAVAFYFLLQNLGTLFGWLGAVIAVLRPFVVGFVLAFILNIPLRYIRPLFNRGGLAQRPGLANALSLLAVYLLLFGIVAAILLFIVPPFVESVRTFAANFEGYYANALAAINRLAAEVDPELWARLGLSEKLNELYRSLPSFIEKLGGWLVGGVFGAVSSLVGGVVDTCLGFLISVYILADKKRMKQQGSRLLRAALPEHVSAQVLRLLDMASCTFSAFFSSQFIEAFILGALCFVGMNIFGFPYAPLVSVIIGITNLIPIVGPIMGTIPCALLLLLAEADLLRTVWFVVFIIALQQLESNLIYPRVVGTQVGLPAFWVLAAVVVGGGLGGVIGMVVGIPALAMLRRLMLEWLDSREAVKQSAAESPETAAEPSENDPTARI